MGTQKRTYEEAVNISVKWWSEKAFATLFNQNNGENSENGGMTFMLMNMVASKAQAKVDTETIEKFEKKLTEILLSQKGKPKYANELEVDYNPNHNLSHACAFAGVDTYCLPCKTFTYIDENNAVKGRYQYGGAWFEL
jgi:hypothetical protein